MRNENGNAILWSLILCSLLLTLAGGMAVILIQNLKQSNQIYDSSNAYMAAEAGYERALHIAKEREVTTVPVTDQRMDSGGRVRYGFEVVKNGDTYDNPPRICYSTDPTDVAPTLNGNKKSFCFISTGTANNAVRKIDGYLVDINRDDAPYVSTGFETNDPNPTLGIVSERGGKYFDFRDSVFGSPSAEKVGLQPTTFVYRGTIDITDSSLTTYAETGIFEQKTVSGQTSRSFLGIFEQHLSGSPNPSFVFAATKYVNGSLNTSLVDSSHPITITDGQKLFRFTITYRRGGGSGNKSAHTMTLQVNKYNPLDSDDKKCYGIVTNYIDWDILPFNAYFGWGTISVDKKMVYRFSGSNITTTVDNPYLRVYY